MQFTELDGPVRGNGKIIQELESDFRGAGWNVIKVVWGSYWDPLIAKDSSGKLLQRMEVLSMENTRLIKRMMENCKTAFFGKHDELKKLVSNLSDEDIWRLNRGGHDLTIICSLSSGNLSQRTANCNIV